MEANGLIEKINRLSEAEDHECIKYEAHRLCDPKDGSPLTITPRLGEVFIPKEAIETKDGVTIAAAIIWTTGWAAIADYERISVLFFRDGEIQVTLRAERPKYEGETWEYMQLLPVGAADEPNGETWAETWEAGQKEKAEDAPPTPGEWYIGKFDEEKIAFEILSNHTLLTAPVMPALACGRTKEEALANAKVIVNGKRVYEGGSNSG